MTAEDKLPKKKPTKPLSPVKIAFMQEITRRYKTNVVTEYKFHPKRKWSIDFYLPDYGLAIELEGGIFTQGRHTRGSGFLGDIEKYNEITASGLSLIRVTYSTLNKNATFDLIGRCIEVLKPKPF